MNLKTYDRNYNFRNLKPSYMTISKDLVFRILMDACQRMNLTNDKGIILHQDADNPTEWFIQIINNPSAHPDCFINTGHNQNYFSFGSNIMARKIKSCFGAFHNENLKIQIAAAPIEYENLELWPLISKSAMINQQPINEVIS